MDKLRTQAGETIGETLFALLIAALALTMLAGAISTAANLITKSESVMGAYYAGLNALGNPSNSGALTVSLNDGSKTVRLFYGDTGAVDYAVNAAFVHRPVIAYCPVGHSGGGASGGGSGGTGLEPVP